MYVKMDVWIYFNDRIRNEGIRILGFLELQKLKTKWEKDVYIGLIMCENVSFRKVEKLNF